MCGSPTNWKRSSAGGTNVGVEAEWIKPVAGEHESEALIDGIIADLPVGQKLVNRKLATPEEGIADFQRRFLLLLENLGQA
jgi:hypothetical protein